MVICSVPINVALLVQYPCQFIGYEALPCHLLTFLWCVCVPLKSLKCFYCINIGQYRVLVEAIDSLLGSCLFGHDWELLSSKFTTSRSGSLHKVDLDANASWVYQTRAIMK